MKKFLSVILAIVMLAQMAVMAVPTAVMTMATPDGFFDNATANLTEESKFDINSGAVQKYLADNNFKRGEVVYYDKNNPNNNNVIGVEQYEYECYYGHYNGTNSNPNCCLFFKDGVLVVDEEDIRALSTIFFAINTNLINNYD